MHDNEIGEKRAKLRNFIRGVRPSKLVDITISTGETIGMLGGMLALTLLHYY